MRAVLALILAGSSVVPAKVATAACSFGAPPPCPSLDARRGAADLSSPAGLWAPIDGKTGQRLGLIRIFQQGGLFFGRIEPSSPSDDRSARCTLCTDERRNQPIIGLVILRHLRLEEGEYVGGDILARRHGSASNSSRAARRCRTRATARALANVGAI